MTALCVTNYTNVKKPVTGLACNHFQMSNAPPTPARRYAENLKKLIAMHEMTVAQVAAIAHVIPKQVYNLLNSSHDPRLKGLEKVANVFNLTAWQMMAFDFTDQPSDNKRVLALLERFGAADEAGRETILSVAEIASNRLGKRP
jgi:transcriptional regulator with XRE-family HTH domain